MMFQRWFAKTALSVMAASAFALVAVPESTHACGHRHGGCGGGGCHGGWGGGCHGGWGGCGGGCYGGGGHAYAGSYGGGYATYGSPYTTSPTYVQGDVERRSSFYAPNGSSTEFNGTESAYLTQPSQTGDFEIQAPANAEVWIDNTNMGTARTFVLPRDAANQGPVHYTLKVTWMDNGRPVTQSKEITVNRNQRQVIDLNTQTQTPANIDRTNATPKSDLNNNRSNAVPSSDLNNNRSNAAPKTENPNNNHGNATPKPDPKPEPKPEPKPDSKPDTKPAKPANPAGEPSVPGKSNNPKP